MSTYDNINRAVHRTNNINEKYLRVGQVADVLSLSRATVRRMIATGDLPVALRTPGGHMRIAVSDAQRMYLIMSR